MFRSLFVCMTCCCMVAVGCGSGASVAPGESSVPRVVGPSPTPGPSFQPREEWLNALTAAGVVSGVMPWGELSLESNGGLRLITDTEGRPMYVSISKTGEKTYFYP
jgi:hypothetical protein